LFTPDEFTRLIGNEITKRSKAVKAGSIKARLGAWIVRSFNRAFRTHAAMNELNAPPAIEPLTSEIVNRRD